MKKKESFVIRKLCHICIYISVYTGVEASHTIRIHADTETQELKSSLEDLIEQRDLLRSEDTYLKLKACSRRLEDSAICDARLYLEKAKVDICYEYLTNKEYEIVELRNDCGY